MSRHDKPDNTVPKPRIAGDWKSALAALGTGEPDNASATPCPAQSKPKERIGVVYSTNPDFAYSVGSEEERETLPKAQQKLRLQVEKAGRGGKTVIMVRGFIGTDSDLHTLCKLLKQKCGVGGSCKDGEIVMQGADRQRLIDILKNEGFTQTK